MARRFSLSALARVEASGEGVRELPGNSAIATFNIFFSWQSRSAASIAGV
jgi:hypothetical protein